MATTQDHIDRVHRTGSAARQCRAALTVAPTYGNRLAAREAGRSNRAAVMDALAAGVALGDLVSGYRPAS